MVDNGDVVYLRDGDPSWRIPLDAVTLIGEFTTGEGPADDYFFAFVVDPSDGWYEASFYSEGRDAFLVALGQALGDNFTASLSNSAHNDSRVMWPAHLTGQPMFQFRPEGILGKLGITSRQALHPDIVAANQAIDRAPKV
jgi:hypothetical protein